MRGIAKLFLGIGLASSLGACLILSHFTLEMKKQESLFVKAEQRGSITFLMGEDKEDHQYFRMAEEHFLHDAEEKTDIVVSSCRSIEDLILYLNANDGQQKWGTIQVVLHGNPWQGLSLPLLNDGPRATKRELAKALIENPLPRIESNSLDTTTKINFWGCGIGKNPFINMALKRMFELPDGETPQIYTSPDFVIFKEVAGSEAPKRIRASYWPYIFKRGYRPSDEVISQALKEQHPDVAIDWSEAVGRANVESHSSYENAFHLPVSWTVIYPTKDARPSVSTVIEQQSWVRSQEPLMDQLEELGIPLDKYTWNIGKRIITSEDGTKVPAIKAIGMATVLCILEEISSI